ncbi:MAG: hypothetical protein KJ587_02640 [Alphaproteobacteria bacterium]|nr:hypothetical protein [Alphaproteobacteria bacterium]
MSAGIVLVSLAVWSGALSRPAGAVEAGAVSTSRSTPPAAPCEAVAVDVTGAAPDEKALICRAAQRSVEFFRRCKLKSSGRIRIEVVAGALDVCGVDVFGSYDASTETVRIVNLKRCTAMAGEVAEYRAPPVEQFYGSIVAHEAAHYVFRKLTRDHSYSHATHEYVAYAAQIDSMPPAVRKNFLKSISRPLPSDLSHFVDIVLMLAPARFGAMAYDHFSAPGNGCRMLRGLVAGTIEFPSIDEVD